MKSISIINLIALTLLILLGACIDIIDLETENKAEDILIVDANLELTSQAVTVFLRKASDFAAGPNGVELPQSGATIRVKEIDGPEVTLVETEEGVYRNPEAIGEAGKSYQLSIEVNGKSYTSTVEKMPIRVPFDVVDHVQREITFNNSQGNIETEEIVAIRSTVNLPNQGDGIYLRFRASGIYQFDEAPSQNDKICYVPEKIDFNQLSIVDGSTLNDGFLNQEEFLTKIVDSKFASNYCFTLVQLSITQNEYNFWAAIENEFERTGDIFEAPPAKINGNVLNDDRSQSDVLGLFSLTVADTAKYLITGTDAGFPTAPCVRRPPGPCFNCLQIQNATYQKPDCL